MQKVDQSLYYQANVERSKCWLVVAGLKSFEHMCFDRTLDPEKSLFEFFVAPDMEDIFLKVMDYFKEKKLVTNLRQLPNRMTTCCTPSVSK